MQLLEKCEKVLDTNWKGNFTVPSPRLYPFQWNWDSGFIAIGNLHSHPGRAILEMETLFSGQWENGFLPHILFHNADAYTSYFPSADYWNSSISPFAPKNLKTSGITQPPVHGFVLEYLFNHNFEKARLEKLYDQIISYHKYLYNYRQYVDSGLVAIWHNWESGMDNSIWWDDALKRIDESEFKDIELFRKDIHEVKESKKTRPENIDYKRYLYLVNKLKSFEYEKIQRDYPFQILDPVFNAILIESNASLIRIGNKLGKDTSFIKSMMDKGVESFSKYLWNDADTLYYPFDIVMQEQIKKHCSGCYVPIFAGIPTKKQVGKLINNIKMDHNLVLLPSCFPDEKGFQKENYWRGPVWVNMNWMIWKGLLKYEMYEFANEIMQNTIDLVEKFGTYEYFEPFVNSELQTGYGGANFSWTAGLIIDMLRSENK